MKGDGGGASSALATLKGISAADFSVKFKAQLAVFEAEKKKGIWVKVPLELSHWISAVVDEGFEYYNAAPTYAVLTRWLPTDEPSRLPKQPHTLIGAAGLVMNKHGEVMVV